MRLASQHGAGEEAQAAAAAGPGTPCRAVSNLAGWPWAAGRTLAAVATAVAVACTTSLSSSSESLPSSPSASIAAAIACKVAGLARSGVGPVAPSWSEADIGAKARTCAGLRRIGRVGFHDACTSKGSHKMDQEPPPLPPTCHAAFSGSGGGQNLAALLTPCHPHQVALQGHTANAY